jgi:hypothetical protein
MALPFSFLPIIDCKILLGFKIQFIEEVFDARGKRMLCENVATSGCPSRWLYAIQVGHKVGHNQCPPRES